MMDHGKSKSTDSWYERARAAGASPMSANEAADSARDPLSGASRHGWDPREVWLSRIEQPRRRRAEGSDGAPG